MMLEQLEIHTESKGNMKPSSHHREKLSEIDVRPNARVKTIRNLEEKNKQSFETLEQAKKKQNNVNQTLFRKDMIL